MIRKKLVIFSLLTSIIIFTSGAFNQVIASSKKPESTADPCLAQADWFPHSKTQEPDADKFQSTSNCVFHQWSWQMFLWLTQEVDNQPRFLSLVSPQSLLGMTHRGIMPRMTKSATAETFDEYLQAGSDSILVDHNGRAVYYSQYLNSDFVNFINENKLTDPTIVQKFDPNTSFPNGAFELKATWKIVAPGEDVSEFFTTKTTINKLVNKDGKIVVDINQTEEVMVALVGFHIAGVVEGHPEMIWATFEHKLNAPNVPPNPTPETIVSKESSTFYTANTKYADCNVNVANSSKQKLDEKTQKLSPITQVCRQFEFGNDPKNPKDRIARMAENDSNIKQLNDSVHRKLGTKGVWSNYYEVGAIWFGVIDGLKPNMSLDTDEVLTGSLKLSNATTETFTQVQSTQNNCFRCHNTAQRFPPKTTLNPLPGLNINISHAFVNIFFWSQEMSASDLKAVNEFLEPQNKTQLSKATKTQLVADKTLKKEYSK
ncbi:hypothetical protein [Aliikangiella sp. IMCC44359]|uniref:hypothetical protein n=1 Tax=Aliikangiella sp. IMCC44359 TaxID=3459125 RepID=UPI00403A8538